MTWALNLADEPWRLTATPPSEDQVLISVLARYTLRRDTAAEASAYLVDVCEDLREVLEERAWTADSAHDEAQALLDAVVDERRRLLGKPPLPKPDRGRWVRWPIEAREAARGRRSIWS